MKNERGSILIVTLGFIVVFTLLGLASIYLAGVQAEAAQKRAASMEAFWLADGAVELARERLPFEVIPVDSPEEGAMGPGQYSVTADNEVIYDADGDPVYTFQFRWVINSEGNVDGNFRRIQASLAGFNAPSNPVTSNGPIDDNFDDVDLDPDDITEGDDDLSLEDIFDEDLDFFVDNADQTYNDTEDIVTETVDGITVVTVETSDTFVISSESLQGSETTLLIVDVQTANENGIIPELQFTTFAPLQGILFVLGEVELVNPDIQGAVFLAGDPALADVISGSGQITLHSEFIDRALGNIGALPADPDIIAWQEI